MGLDVFHCMLSNTPNEENNYFLLGEDDEWETECNVPLMHYARFITDINQYDFNKSIAVVNNENEYKLLMDNGRLESTSFLKVFIGSREALEPDIERFIESQGLQEMERSEMICAVQSVGESTYASFYKAGVSRPANELEYESISFGELVKVKGMYYDEVGYQRSGMSDAFHIHFKKFFLWGLKEDFEFAGSCVGDKWYIEKWGEDAVQEMKSKFKIDFADKYVFGQSLLMASF